MRTDILEVHLARIVHLAIFIGIADESCQRVALSVESAFRECPFIFHLLVFRVRQKDVELHVNAFTVNTSADWLWIDSTGAMS